jgi:aryl-alcohol dehydrogenase-like predicted oxidoreductase
MKYTKLGKTNIDVSVIAMGCWPLAGDLTWGPQDEAESITTVHAALDAGINFFDTAEIYGDDGYSEVVLGKALAGRRAEAVIATKVADVNLAADNVQKACEASLRRLDMDYVDLYMIHWPNWGVPLAETLGAMMRLREQGKVRAVGVSNFGVKDLTDGLAVTHLEINQVPYSLLWRAIEFEIQQLCIDRGVDIVAYSPLLQGLLAGLFQSPDEVPDGRARTRHYSKDRPHTRHGEPGCEAETFATVAKIQAISEEIGHPMSEVAVAWVLAQPGVSCTLLGMRRPDEVACNIRALDLTLSPDAIAALNAASEDLKQILGSNPDFWQSESRYR